MKFAWMNKASTPKTPAGSLEERVQTLESGLRSLALEWEDTYEKLMRALRRLNKRAQDQREREEAEDAKTHEDALGTTNGLPPLMDPISARIHAWRNRVPPRDAGQG